MSYSKDEIDTALELRRKLYALVTNLDEPTAKRLIVAISEDHHPLKKLRDSLLQLSCDLSRYC